MQVEQYVLKADRSKLPVEITDMLIFAEAMFEQGDHESAYQIYTNLLMDRRLAERNLLVAEIHNWMGIISERRGRYDKAVQHYNSAIAFLSDTPVSQAEVRINLGDIYSNESRLADAFREYEQALRLLGANADAKLREVIHTRILNVGASNRHISSMLDALTPDEPTPEYLRNKALILINLADWDEAEQNLRRAVELAHSGDQRLESVLLNDLAFVLNHQNRLQSAIDAYSEAISVSESVGDLKTSAVVHNNLALVLKGMGNYQDAVKHLVRSLEIRNATGDNDSSSNVLFNLASTYFAMGLYDLALTELQKAIQLDRKKKDETALREELELLSRIQKAQNTADKP